MNYTRKKKTDARDEEPGVDDIKSVVGVGNSLDSVALFELYVTRDFGPSRPVGSKVNTEARDLGELCSHFSDPDHQLRYKETRRTHQIPDPHPTSSTFFSDPSDSAFRSLARGAR